MKAKINTKKLAVSAIMIALSTVLSLVIIWRMPLDGTITLFSMLPICLLSIIYGIKWGFACSFVYALAQLALSIASVVGWGLTPVALAGTIAFDYIIPFTLLGISGIFKNKGLWGSLLGIGIALFARFICHFISGVIFFGSVCPWGEDQAIIYSICYNGTYMLPELILTVIGAFFLLKAAPIKKLIENNK